MRARHAWLLVGIAGLLACSGGGKGSNAGFTDAVLVSLKVGPASARVPLGLNAQFAATGAYSDGSTQDLTAQVIWSSSNESIATLSADIGEAGFVTGVATGTATITARHAATGLEGTATCAVTDAVLVSVVVSTATPSVPLGHSAQFVLTATFSDGSTHDVTADAAWSSSSPGVATVSNEPGARGVATTVGAGTTVITAVLSGASPGSAELIVTDPVLESIAIGPSNATIPLGTAQPFTATGTYSDGSVRDVTGQVAWASSDAAVARFSGAAGLATGIGKGSVTITASAPGLADATATLVITDAVLVSLSVAPQAASVPVGFDAQFVATGAYSDGSILDLTAQVVWTSSDDAIAALSTTVGEAGLVRGVSTGTAAITAREAATGLEAHATCAVTNAVAVSVAVSTATPSVPLGRPAQFVATGTFSDGSTNDVTAHATWSSSSPAVAVVSNDLGSQGLATTVGTGTTSITAALGAVPPASADLTVTDAVLESMEVNPSNPTIVAGGSITLDAVGIWSDGAVASLAVPVTWSSSDAAVATVSDGGLVRGLAVGTTTVTADDAADGLTGSTIVTVVSPGSAVLSYVSVSPGSVKSGRTAMGTVVFTGPFAADVTVALASDQPYAAVPQEVILPAGETSVTFTITTSAPPPATKKSTKARATISATTTFDGVVSKTARLMVRR